MPDMLPIMIIILFIAIVVGILVTIIALMKKTEGKYEEPDYRVFFILGICFLPLGFIFMVIIDNPGFIAISGLGIAYFTIGLTNIKKWKEN
jgi:hypothetical protein